MAEGVNPRTQQAIDAAAEALAHDRGPVDHLDPALVARKDAHRAVSVAAPLIELGVREMLLTDQAIERAVAAWWSDGWVDKPEPTMMRRAVLAALGGEDTP